MQTHLVLLIDSRQELSTKYKKLIEQKNIAKVEIVKDISGAKNIIASCEPDLIIITDNVEEDTLSVCKDIRQKNIGYRPVIIRLSKSSYLDDKLKALNSGADDFLSEPIDQTEFCARIHAHLRRNYEEFCSPITKLPLAHIAFKVLKRTLNEVNEWALLYIDIDNFEPYRMIYGELAATKMLQAFAAILKSAIDFDDFLGQLDENKFMLILPEFKAEKLAQYLNYAFDSVAPKFYSKEDAKRGYIVLSSDGKAGRRTSLVSSSVGIISNKYRQFADFKEAINSVESVHKLAKAQPGSSCVSERLQLSGATKESFGPKKLLVVESDAALAYLLITTLEMQGYQVEAISNYNETIEKIESYRPDLVILDAGTNDDLNGFEVCKTIKQNEATHNVKIILSTVVHDKEMVLNTGAELYLPKPYELVTLFDWINKLLLS